MLDPSLAPIEPRPEARATPRYRTAVHVTARSEHTFWTGLTRDIGEGGVFVVTPAALPIGTEVHLTLALEDAPPEGVLAIVRWVRGPDVASLDLPAGMGLRFVDLPDGLRRAIQDFGERRRDSLFYDDDPLEIT